LTFSGGAINLIVVNPSNRQNNKDVKLEEIILRKELIKKGNIRPSKEKIDKRNRLIESGFICPVMEYNKLSDIKNNQSEGEYEPKSIDESNYERKLYLYFYMLQGLIISRRELKLQLDRPLDTDPKWFF
jgi:hypothetical protein